MNFHIKNDTAATHGGDSFRNGPVPTLSGGSQRYIIYNKVRPSEQSKGLHIAKGRDCPNGMLKCHSLDALRQPWRVRNR